MNYPEKSLIFRIWIKNTSKYKSRLKKPYKNESKMDQNSNEGLEPKFGTFGVPVGTNLDPSPRALGLG